MGPLKPRGCLFQLHLCPPVGRGPPVPVPVPIPVPVPMGVVFVDVEKVWTLVEVVVV